MILQISKRLTLLIIVLTALAVTTSIIQPPAISRAAGAQLTLSGQTTGRAGTTFHIDGSSLTPDGTYNLYATQDTTKCTIGDPGTLGLQVFTPATITVSGGALSQDLKWPGKLNQAGKYFLCIVDAATLNGAKTLSTNTFTVAPAATLDVTPNNIAAGQNVMITGTNWLPVQPLNVAVVVSNSDAPALVENTNVTPDTTGSFSISLLIPDNATARSYAVRAYAVNDQGLSVTKNDSLIVTQQATPTPTQQPSPTPTATTQAATPAPEQTPTPNTVAPSNPDTTTPGQDTRNASLTLLIFGMAGLGILFVLIGAVIFAVSAQTESA